MRPSSRRMCIFCTQRACIYTFCAKVPHFFVRFCCRTPQGVRGLKYGVKVIRTVAPRRTPQGVRGLKSLSSAWTVSPRRSHPARGAWIEMWQKHRTYFFPSCRTPQGVRGLKFDVAGAEVGKRARRTPQGVRGLKSSSGSHRRSPTASHPARGAWIEMAICSNEPRPRRVAPRKGCVD